MKTTIMIFAFAATALGLYGAESASAQNAILAQMYGRGVHAYYAGNSDEAYQYLSMAIDNGSQDPRAYYFRGMVAQATGRTYEAESDWRQGAEMEASGKTNASVGRSLARFQGSARIKLEEIRQRAKLEALATSMSRSQQRYGEIGAAPAGAAPPAPSVAAPPAAAAAPPAAPPAAPAGDDLFGDNLAEGEPSVVADDALEGAMDDPFADDAAADAAGAAPAGDNPFGGGGAGDADPFGGGGDAGGAPADDPFGGNPFGS